MRASRDTGVGWERTNFYGRIGPRGASRHGRPDMSSRGGARHASSFFGGLDSHRADERLLNSRPFTSLSSAQLGVSLYWANSLRDASIGQIDPPMGQVEGFEGRPGTGSHRPFGWGYGNSPGSRWLRNGPKLVVRPHRNVVPRNAPSRSSRRRVARGGDRWGRGCRGADHQCGSSCGA